MSEPFHFRLQLTQIELLGRRAGNITELRRHLREIPDSSIYYHTHHRLRQHIIRSPEPPNDFSFWLTKALGLAKMAETFSSLPFASFRSIAEIRQAFLAPLDAFLLEENGHHPQAPAGMELHLLDGRTFLLPTGLQARTPAEFKTALAKAPIGSIQYHVFAPRLGMAPPEFDFAAWLDVQGCENIAAEIRRLDPYTMTLETLRTNIRSKVAEHVAS
ncbi:MAG: hypothetical protein JW843_00180 [Candidatus Aminicenantes bacterium]|nr:hypothetical protein [Candidatus Aminicenantes bacterium]